jgi:hypothetical protein
MVWPTKEKISRTKKGVAEARNKLPTAPLVEQTRRVKGGRISGLCLSEGLEEGGLTVVATRRSLFVQCNAAILRDTHSEEPGSRNGNRR